MAISRKGANAPQHVSDQPDDRDTAHQAGNDDLDTLLAAKADARAFEPLYRRYQPQVYGYCLRRLGNPELAADATSQIFINAIKALPKFNINAYRVDSKFRSWLFSIAHNVVIDIYRRQRPMVSLNTPEAEEFHQFNRHTGLPDPDPTPEEAVIAAETARSLVMHVARLPKQQRAVIELRLVGLSRVEIAKALHLSEAAVRSAQFRGFASLRQHMLDSQQAPEPSARGTEISHDHT